ncbi:MAG TPA: six-cysteine peptide SCIFF [Firmicutes bacterium]|nr:six-cysteine peptide SCIFF [Candidatus Fermentithermobacillaceae bacterium]
MTEKKDQKAFEGRRHIKPVILPDWTRKDPACDSCQASCQSACKTSCTVSNQPCPER